MMATLSQASDLQAREIYITSSNVTIKQMQVLNHALLIKLDRNNYILWQTQMEYVVYVY